MEKFKIVVIGASAGGVEASLKLLHDLPRDLDAAVFLVVHLSPSAPSSLAEVLDRRSNLPVNWAQEGALIAAGHVYVAPPDRHVLIEGDRITLGSGPREGGHRPAVDPLFRTAAHSYCERVIGVILSGNLDDGSVGLAEIRRMGGYAIVQDPAEALYADMPANARAYAGADAVLPLSEIGKAIVAVVNEDAPAGTGCAELPEDIAGGGKAPMSADEREQGILSPYGCPDCGGALWEIQGGELTRYRCRVGHAYSDESLLEAGRDGVERAMWAALRALEEHRDQAHRLARRMRARGHASLTKRFSQQALEAEERASLIRRALLSAGDVTEESAD